MASEYLDPYDELMSSRFGTSVVDANMEQNPLYQRDKAALSGIAQPPPAPEEEVAATAPAAVVANPFVRPPVPLSTMTTDRQIEWQKMQQDAATKQAALERAALELTSGRRKEELDRQGVTQATALLGETGGLRPDDLSNYPQQRTELMRKYPVGAMTNEAKNILSQYDTIYQNALQIDKEARGRQDQASINREAQRREGGEKMALALGTDVLSKFYQVEKDQGTEAAIQATMGEAAKGKKENLVATLLNSGMTQEDINKKFYNPQGEFLYPAAEAQAKVRTNPQLDVKRAADTLADMTQEKREAGRKWTPQQQEVLDRQYALYNVAMDRAGIKLPTDPNATVTNPTPTPTARPSPTPVARPTATPSPTPATEPPKAVGPNGEMYIYVNGGWFPAKTR